MDRNKAGLRKGPEQSLRFIEFRLFWEGASTLQATESALIICKKIHR